ncbi:MAG: hypothetical protein ACKO3G_05535, partial [Planctomycetaceae bacterium]
GKGRKDYTKKLAKKAGLENPTDDELRQFDRTRPGKKVSNDDWENPHDADAAITRMKDGTTRMGYKAAPKTRRFPPIALLRKGCLPPSGLHLISAPENRGPPHSNTIRRHVAW